MILSAHQPQFAPWLGFFDKLDRSDVFVLLDNVQYKKNEWQNRNRIKSASGPQWLTVPVSFRFGQTIREVAVCNRAGWRRRHRATLQSCYGRAPFFQSLFSPYQELLHQSWEHLSELNIALLATLKRQLGIFTPILLASELDRDEKDRDARLIGLCRDLGADTYLAGEGGRAYMDLERFAAAGIRVLFQTYQHPVYPQLFGGFEPSLSVLDLLFNCGQASLGIIRGGSLPAGKEGHEHTCHRRTSR